VEKYKRWKDTESELETTRCAKQIGNDSSTFMVMLQLNSEVHGEGGLASSPIHFRKVHKHPHCFLVSLSSSASDCHLCQNHRNPHYSISLASFSSSCSSSSSWTFSRIQTLRVSGTRNENGKKIFAVASWTFSWISCTLLPNLIPEK